MFKKTFATLFFAGALTAMPALAQSTAQPKEKLDDKDNPLLIGKRDLNKGSINFYSLAGPPVGNGGGSAIKIDYRSIRQRIRQPYHAEYRAQL